MAAWLFCFLLAILCSNPKTQLGEREGFCADAGLCWAFQGTLLGVCGSTGSGKSSLLSAVLGEVSFSPREAGRTRWGRPVCPLTRLGRGWRWPRLRRNTFVALF